MRFSSLCRAFGAWMILLMLLGLCACSAPSPAPTPAPTAAPEETPTPALSGRWTSSLDIGEELSAALGFDLTPWLEAPLTAELRLEIRPDGTSTLTRDDASCAPALRAALAACVSEMQAQEDGEALSGLALAEALGADPNDFAAAICDELLLLPVVTAGRYDDAHGEILWNDGAVWPLVLGDGALRVALPDSGELLFSPAD